MSFLVTWSVALIVLLIFALFAGRASGKGWLGILIDDRGRYSLNHFQIVLWTLLVLSTLAALVFYTRPPLTAALEIPKTLLLLMGISVGSAATAGAVKSGKEVRNAAVQTKGILPAAAVQPGGPVFLPPRPAQIVLEEEGPMIDQIVDVTKFQNLIFTLVIAGIYVTLLIDRATSGSPGYPNLDAVPNLLWLLGISHAGYLAGKLPDKPAQSSGGAINAALVARGPVPPPPPPPPPGPRNAALAAPEPGPDGPPPPTWENGIRDLFNALDVNHMLRDPGGSGNPLDLASYESVKANGPRIYSAVASGFMPLAPSPKWTAAMKADFKAWMDAGYPEA
jgi:hypothetical protein